MKDVMNQGKIVITAAFLLLSAVACGNSGEENEQNETETIGAVDESVRLDQVGEEAGEVGEVQPILTDYMEVKKALVSDNYVLVKQAAADMLNSLEGSGYGQDLETSVEELAVAKDIQAQRKAFAQVSQQLFQLVQNKEISGPTLYWKHCPMAMNNQGANWLSFEKQIQNPYMGQRMPGCGSVKETLSN